MDAFYGDSYSMKEEQSYIHQECSLLKVDRAGHKWNAASLDIQMHTLNSRAIMVKGRYHIGIFLLKNGLNNFSFSLALKFENCLIVGMVTRWKLKLYHSFYDKHSNQGQKVLRLLLGGWESSLIELHLWYKALYMEQLQVFN